jgi:hypothetical protein
LAVPLYLSGYIDALQRGWSPNNLRGKAAADEERFMKAPQLGGTPALRYRMLLR